MPLRFFINYSFLFFLLFLTSGCSVSSSGKKFSQLVPETSPSAEITPEVPLDPLDPNDAPPVLVTAPVDLQPEETPPQEESPIPTTPTMVDVVQPTPDVPPLVLIEESPVPVPVAVESEPVPEQPVLEVDRPHEESPAPPALVNAIDEVDIETDVEPSDEAEDFDQVKDDDDEISDVVLEGSCFSKKRVALLLKTKKKSQSHRKRTYKSITVECRDNKYSLKIRGKKKRLRSLDVQAAFY